MSKLGINGFGRIGRLVLRRLLEVDSPLEVVAINDLTSPKVLAYLLKHDSNYGPFPWSVDFTEDALIVDGKKITVYAEKEAQHIPWKAVGAGLQDHQADAEGEPQGEQVAGAEDAFVGGDRDVRGISVQIRSLKRTWLRAASRKKKQIQLLTCGLPLAA